MARFSCALTGTAQVGAKEGGRTLHSEAAHPGSPTKTQPDPAPVAGNSVPARGGTVTEENYANDVSKYFGYMRNIVKTEQPKFRIMANDITSLLKKFSSHGCSWLKWTESVVGSRCAHVSHPNIWKQTGTCRDVELPAGATYPDWSTEFGSENTRGGLGEQLEACLASPQSRACRLNCLAAGDMIRKGRAMAWETGAPPRGEFL